MSQVFGCPGVQLIHLPSVSTSVQATVMSSIKRQPWWYHPTASLSFKPAQNPENSPFGAPLALPTEPPTLVPSDCPSFAGSRQVSSRTQIQWSKLSAHQDPLSFSNVVPCKSSCLETHRFPNKESHRSHCIFSGLEHQTLHTGQNPDVGMVPAWSQQINPLVCLFVTQLRDLQIIHHGLPAILQVLRLLHIKSNQEWFEFNGTNTRVTQTSVMLHSNKFTCVFTSKFS